MAELSRLKKEHEEASSLQASKLAQRLEDTTQQANKEQLQLSAKISRMKQLSDLALGVGGKSTNTPSGEPPKGTRERNRALLYDNVRKG